MVSFIRLARIITILTKKSVVFEHGEKLETSRSLQINRESCLNPKATL